MTTTYFFSHNGWAITDLYDDVYELIRNTPRMEECYVYVGEDGLDSFGLLGRAANAWDEYRKHSLNALDWIKKENEKLKKCIKNKDFVIDELVQQKIKRSKQCKELKKENEKKNHTILTWKMSASLKDTEIDELKDELEELKKMNQKNYDEKEKMKAFLGELRINVVKKH